MALKDKLMTLEDFKAVRDVDVASNNKQFTDIKADLGSLMEPQRLSSGTDLNTVTTPGTYTLHTGATYTNKPTSDAEHGILEVWHEDYDGNPSRIFQRLTYTYKAGRTCAEIWIRASRTISGSEWTPWVSVFTPSVSNEAKEALLNCFRNVAWVNNTGNTLINILSNALYGGEAPVDSRLVYELTNTDISNTGMNTGVPVFPLGKSFTILANVSIDPVPSTRTNAILLNHGSLSTGTLRLGFDNSEGTLKFITVTMHVTQYGSVQPSSNVSHNAIWIVRMTGTTAKKVLYVDGVKACDEEENISSYASGKTFTGNYLVSRITESGTANYFPGTVNMLRIYNESLSASEIKAIMGVDI